MPTTLSQLRTMVRSAVDEPSPRFWQDQELNLWINSAVREIARRAENVWSYNTTVTVTANVATYALPGDVIRIHRIEFQPTGQNQTYLVRPSTQYEMDAWWGINQNSPGSFPSFFVTRGFPGGSGTSVFQVQLWPVPSQGGTLILYYFRVPLGMYNESDTAEIPEGWQDLVIPWVEAEAKRKAKDPTWKDAIQVFEARLQTMIDVTRQWHDQSQAVSTSTGVLQPWWLYGGGDL